MIRTFLAIAAKVGAWSKAHDSEGACYADETLNVSRTSGFVCHNCAFWKAPNGCAIVKGAIHPQGICRLHVIPQERIGRKAESVSAAPRRPRGRIDGETL